MHALRTHVAGIDTHKEILAVTVLRGDADKDPEVAQFECNTFTEDLMACALKLLELGVTEVAVESSGVYWKPIHNVFSPMGISLTVAQAAHVKNVPGRKTDMNDSHWLATLHRYGLIRPSFIPEDVFQRMRLLSRHRTNLVEDLARIKNRVQRILEDGNVKYGTIASDVFGKSGIQVLRAIASGITDANQLVTKVTTKLKRKDEARKSLTNCLTKDHCFLIRELMAQFDDISKRIITVENELLDKVRPYKHLIDRLKEIPGISEILAIGILAEATDDMTNFKDERSFAAWSGVAAGNKESGGKKKRAKCRQGNPHLRRTLIQAANAAKQKRGSFYRAKYNKLKFRLGSANKAKVAVANRLARVIYKVLAGDKYKDIGYARANEHEDKIRILIGQLKSLGVDIRHEGHEKIISVRKLTVSDSAVILN